MLVVVRSPVEVEKAGGLASYFPAFREGHHKRSGPAAFGLGYP